MRSRTVSGSSETSLRKPLSEKKKNKGQKGNKVTPSTEKAHTTTASEDMWMASNGTSIRGWDFYRVDCACSAHVTSRRMSSSNSLRSRRRPVKGFEGSVLYARGQGNSKLKMRLPNNDSRDVTIRNVLYVPGSVNLFSQGMLMELSLRVAPVNGYGINIYNKNNCFVACAPQVAWVFPFDLI